MHHGHARELHGDVSTGTDTLRAADRASRNKPEGPAGKLNNSEKMTSERVFAPKRSHNGLKEEAIRR